MKKIILLNILFLNLIYSQQTPAPTQDKSVLIYGSTAHIGNGEAIKNSVIGFTDGVIDLVASTDGIWSNEILMMFSDSNSKKYDTIIDASNSHIYPGIIALNTNLGLVEVDAVRASVDDDETGTYLPEIRSIIAYNAESKAVESMRPNGVLLAQIAPNGGIISGKSSVVQFDAWNWEDAVIKYDQGIHLNWPSPYTFGRWWLGEDRGLKANNNYSKQIKDLKDFFEKSKANMNIEKSMNLKSNAMKTVLDGETTVYLHADDEKEIVDGVTFLKSFGIDKIVIVGATESKNQLNFIKVNNIPVVVKQPYRFPQSVDSDPMETFAIAKKMLDAGILVSIDPTGTASARVSIRNLPFYAGSFSSFGIDKEVALSMITHNPAKILGIDKDFGTLEVGKSATLFISKGDALDIISNNVTHAFISGRNLSLETHQTRLWRRYSNKYSDSQ
ncbi:amidohydrolase family protein [Flavobacteriaceae bacterium]|nr:amidohydrolase family protein [Flavobacteriaceae bacterium]MDC0560030.1 amidohydrolase family protein [Flavobacteriaceae bacterium]|tara:strand:+ start:1800 stop:3131 length:1332 start_codon:yes stop_codon:yes gene_type:complete